MTLHAPEGLAIVLMEKLDGLTKKLDCNADDGFLALTFKSKDAFDQALQKWSFTNQREDKNFIFIANHDGCGPDDERQPYHISKIREDAKTLTTFLTARVATWSEVAGTYTMDFGRVLPHSRTRKRMKKRDLISDVEKTGSDIVKDTVDGATKAATDAVESVEEAFKKLGTADITESVTFNVGIGTPALRTNIVTSLDKHIKIDCIDCYITGTFKVSGRIVVKNFELQDFTMDVSPVTVSAKAVLQATITAQEKLLNLDVLKELYAVGIPGAGIAVTNIFKIGATLAYQIGVTSTFSGQGVVNFGLQAGIPDAAKVIAKLKNPASNSAVNFDGPLTPVFNVKTLTAGVNFVAFSQARLAFGAEVNNVGKADIAMTFIIPKVTAQLTAANVATGVCSPGSSPTGVRLTSKVDVEVDLDYDASLKISPVPAKRQKLYATSRPLLNTCISL
ncbi:hypothetical protein MMC29_001348 [Sticta canariensis]|nr:hypothetical protein [Sticta canariensis]